jgi:hypothetical protein
MSATSVKLLQTAAEIVGSTRVLAWRLGISEALLSRFMADRRELPDKLFLLAVDIVLEDKPSVPRVVAQSANHPTSMREVAGTVEELHNCARGSGAATETGTAG